MKLNIIYISGRARSGKDTIARFIQDEIPEAVIMALATPLKLELLRITPDLTMTLLDHHKNSNIPFNGISIRTALIQLSDKLKANDPTIFLKWADRQLAQLEENSTVIISDLRLVYECGYLLMRYGGTIIKVVGDVDETVSTSNHPTETDVVRLPHHHLVYNDKKKTTLLALKGKIKELMNSNILQPYIAYIE